MENLLKTLVKDLECPVCLECMVPPIVICKSGHNICSTCRQKLQNCPTCREPFSSVRCIALENFARYAKYPCKFRESGCEEAVLMENIASHQAECPHRHYRCPFSIMKNKICSWEGHVTKIENHIRSKHTEPGNTRSVRGKYKIIIPHVDTKCECYQAIFSLGEIFFLYTRITENNMCFCILYVGPKEKAPSYRYRITMNKPDMSASASACHVTCSHLSDVEEIFRKGDCAVFYHEFAKKCMNKKKCLVTECEIFSHVT
jgi:E3 ubiquitin-protein ligase SIAH1